MAEKSPYLVAGSILKKQQTPALAGVSGQKWLERRASARVYQNTEHLFSRSR
jgi:hypothetical protein